MVQWFSEIIDKGCSPLMGVILRHCSKGFSPNQQHFLPKWGFPTNKTLSLGVFHPLFKYVCHLVIFCFVRTLIIPNGQYWQGSIANYRLIIGSCQVEHQNFSVRPTQVNSHINSESSVSFGFFTVETCATLPHHPRSLLGPGQSPRRSYLVAMVIEITARRDFEGRSYLFKCFQMYT